MKNFINGQTEIYGLVGYPVSHSLSPKIQNFLFNRFELNSVYVVFNARHEKDDFKNFLICLSKIENFKGLNITIPYKEWAAEFTENDFKSLGAINCIKFINGKLIATNTDIYGFKKAVEEDLNFSFKNKNILIFGAGATAKSIIFGIIHEVKKIFIVNRTLDNAKKLRNSFGNSDKVILDFPEDFKEIDLIINATPIGLHGEELKIDFDNLKKDCCFFDVLYIESPLIKNARKKGFNAITGKSMLLYQAIKSFEFWTKLEVSKILEKKILTEIL